MLVINGRFTQQPQTGVQRYAQEISALIEGEIISPPYQSRIGGNIWEQCYLPLASGSELLWSPCNSGPVIKRRQILTIHDVSVFDHPEWFSRAFRLKCQTLLPLLAKNCLAITTPSYFSKKRIESVLSVPEKKINVIPCGVSESFFSQQQDYSDIKKYTGGYQYILSVSSIEPRKNHKNLIRAWNKISARYPEYKLLLVGSHFDCFSDLAFNSKESSIIFTGYVDENTLRSLYKSASLFVYPTLYEGFGIPLLEAMAAGVPVITSDIEVITEVVKDCAVKINPRDYHALSKAIDTVLSDNELRQNLTNKGLDRAELFSWNNPAQKMQSLVNSLH